MFNDANSITLTVPETQDYLAKVRKNMIGFDDWFTEFDQHFKNTNNYLIKANFRICVYFSDDIITKYIPLGYLEAFQLIE